MDTIYTVGHSTRSADEFRALLESAGIQCLVDVRRFPGSRRYPHFNRENLSHDLGAAGIDYRHFPALGGRRTPDAESPNQFWRVAGFRAYADYMSTAQFRGVVRELQQIARETVVAIMCAEAVPWRCHRQLIADALTADGWTVQHLMAQGKTNLHVLNQAARVTADGSLVYPATKQESTLFD